MSWKHLARMIEGKQTKKGSLTNLSIVEIQLQTYKAILIGITSQTLSIGVNRVKVCNQNMRYKCSNPWKIMWELSSCRHGRTTHSCHAHHILLFLNPSLLHSHMCVLQNVHFKSAQLQPPWGKTINRTSCQITARYKLAYTLSAVAPQLPWT